MLLRGNCLDQLKTLSDNSVDSVVTDPPYELGFMGKSWDSSGIAYNAELWEQCLRVLKPGGHLLAFGGSRTIHRIAVAIEDAGFEIRDSIHWTYGSGFPKSLDISKAIDKAAGAEREVVGSKFSAIANPAEKDRHTIGASKAVEVDITAPSTPEAQQWQGWGTALKPSHEPIVVARKPLIGTVAANVLEYGTGGLNIDGTRVGTTVETWPASRSYAPGQMQPGHDGATQTTGPVPSGRWPANTVITHHPDCEQVGTRSDKMTGGFGHGGIGMGEIGTDIGSGQNAEWQNKEVTVPVWDCAEGCPVLELDRQSGVSKSVQRTGKRTGKPTGTYGNYTGQDEVSMGHNDTGGASRFFTQTTYTEADYPAFLYYAKASKRERNQGLEGLEVRLRIQSNQARAEMKRGNADYKEEQGALQMGGRIPQTNFHPTVKPVELMRHLIRLVTPPNGTVLDPFLGSGTTAVSAILEGMKWIGCELTEDYWPIIEARTAWATEQTDRTLF